MIDDVKGRLPVVIDVDAGANQPLETPADVAPVPEHEVPNGTPAMERVAGFVARKPSRLFRLFLGAVVALLGFMLSVALWDFAAELLVRNVWLGRIALVLLLVSVGALLLMVLRELAALARLRKIDILRHEAEHLHLGATLEQAQAYGKKLAGLYHDRSDQRWALATLSERGAETFDPEAMMVLTEATLLAPLDKQASQQVETAARQVATATALIPLAFADVTVALAANLRMIRQIAQIYGGRSGSFGSWRLIRAVAGHLVATGAVAIGDDLIGTIAGGGVVSKLSRRFGEGMINGALTARVGIAAMEICRPMPFNVESKPSVSRLIKRALTGLFA